MKKYGLRKKRHGKIHNSDKCVICSNHEDKTIKKTERRSAKEEIRIELIEEVEFPKNYENLVSRMIKALNNLCRR